VLLLLVLGAAGVGLIAAGNLDLGPVVITREGEQKIILLFGDARKVTTPGASLRIPLLEDVERYDARWLWLDTERRLIPTKDEERIVVDNYVVWRIQDAVAYRRAFRGELARAEERIDKVVGNDVREVIGQYTLTDVLKDKRIPIMEMITEKTRGTLAEYGIQVAGVRINRTELPEGTEENVYARMKTERERLAKKSRAEGQERARRIRAEADRDARVIVANAKRDAEIARGFLRLPSQPGGLREDHRRAHHPGALAQVRVLPLPRERDARGAGRRASASLRRVSAARAGRSRRPRP
jgi:membrane protease subunit HflC